MECWWKNKLFSWIIQQLKKVNDSFKLIEWFTGCCCLFDSKLFKDIGKFDERFLHIMKMLISAFKNYK